MRARVDACNRRLDTDPSLLTQGRAAPTHAPYEPVAQVVEHLTFNQVVLGSSPSGLTKSQKDRKRGPELVGPAMDAGVSACEAEPCSRTLLGCA
jgi:hypothetical protein